MMGSRKEGLYTVCPSVRIMAGKDDERFDSTKAELFEQLGHPVRIRIIEELYAAPLNFSALKAKTGITSNGHLHFHLAKLKDLVIANNAGEYYLTDNGRDSMRVASMIDWQKYSKRGEEEIGKSAWRPNIAQILALLLVASLFVSAGLAYSLREHNSQEMQLRRGIFNHLSSDIDDIWSSFEAGLDYLTEEDYEMAHYHLSDAVEFLNTNPLYHSMWLGSDYQTLYFELETPIYQAFNKIYWILDAVWNGNVTTQQIVYMGGWMKAFRYLDLDELRIRQNTDYALSNSTAIVAHFKQFILSAVPSELPVTEEEAVALAMDFLNSRGHITGTLISTDFTLEHPNYYWHDVFGMDAPYRRYADLFWIIDFEQDQMPNRSYQVWVNVYSGEIQGGGETL